jgi:sortase A
MVRLLFIFGFLLCCFPAVSNYFQQQRQADAVATYRQAVGKNKEDGLEEALEKAKEYNNMLFQSGGAAVDQMDMKILSDKSYQRQLDVAGNGIMGSLEIPKINVELPIYHGTEEEALSNGIGHLQGTSLPVGGMSTRSVLTGHRGLPSAKLLVRLDEIEKKDLFFLRVCGKTLAYRVTEIKNVEPEDTASLKIKADQDLVSIITCTPYGINTHRLVVTGERVTYRKTEHEAVKEGVPSVRELVLTALPFVFAMAAVILFIWERRRITYEG